MQRALIFDSGIGGLSVSAHIRALMPELSLIYVADDAFRPYGDKSAAQLGARLPQLLRTLEVAAQPDVIIIACNTASTTALPAIRALCKAPIIGVVPAIKPAAQQSRTHSIGVLGTPATVAHRYVDRLIADFASDCAVSLCGSTALVDMAERKLIGEPVSLSALKAQIAPLYNASTQDPDILVLACTHFPLLAEELLKVTPPGTRLVDSGEAVARRVKTVLGQLPARTGAAPFKAPDTALLIGPDAGAARKKAFAKFGYHHCIGLCR